MNAKQFERYLARDHRCLHCGTTETLVPNHRANRGMGGSAERHRPSNIVVICSRLNGLIESDSRYANAATEYGWKIASWQNPLEVSVYDQMSGEWRLLDDEYGYKVLHEEGQE